MTQIVVAFIVGVFGPITVLLIKHLLTRKKDTLQEAFIQAEEVNDRLQELLENYQADRIYINQFHNGGHFYPTGKSIQKFSMFYEITSNAKDSVKMQYQNIPVYLFSKSLASLTKESFIAIPDYKNETIATCGLKYLAEEHGTKSSYIFGIYNLNDKLIGVLGIDYTKRKHTLSAEELVDLRLEAASIGGALDKYLKG